MKKDTLKEFGKFHYDVAKIIIAIGVIGKFVKNEQISNGLIAITFVLVIIGTILINKGASDE